MPAARAALAAGLLVLAAGRAAAFPIPFSSDPCPSGFDCYGFKAGPVTAIAPEAPPALQAFRVGEPLYGRFDIDDTAPDQDGAPDAGEFIIEDGGFQLGGLDSGAVLDIAGGVEIAVTPTRFALGTRADASGPDLALHLDQVIFEFGFEAFPEPDILADTVQGSTHLFAEDGWLLFENLSHAPGTVAFFDGESSVAGMTFAAPSRNIPLPATLPLLLAPLAAAAALRRRRAALRSRPAPPAPAAPRG